MARINEVTIVVRSDGREVHRRECTWDGEWETWEDKILTSNFMPKVMGLLRLGSMLYMRLVQTLDLLEDLKDTYASLSYAGLKEVAREFSDEESTILNQGRAVAAEVDLTEMPNNLDLNAHMTQIRRNRQNRLARWTKKA